RVVNAGGTASNWTLFANPAFVVAAPQPPTGTQVVQVRTDGSSIGLNGTVTGSPNATVNFKATVSDPGGATAKLQVELRQVSEAFTNTSLFESSLGASGTTVT